MEAGRAISARRSEDSSEVATLDEEEVEATRRNVQSMINGIGPLAGCASESGRS